jgi:VanZ family protein
MRAARWVPPAMWMAAILWLASDTGSTEHTSRILLPVLRFVFPGASPSQLGALHGLVRKLAHVTEYAILTGLWLRALMAGGVLASRTAAWRAAAIALAWAVVDESFQATVASRTGSPVDVAIDAVGVLAVALPAAIGWRILADSLTGILLWTAAVGGTALLAINLATGVDAGVLWLAVPVAAAMLVWRRRGRGRS